MYNPYRDKDKLSCESFVEFYLLDMIHFHVHSDSTLLPSEKHFLPSVQHLVRELEEYKSEFEEAFALRLRDYLWFAALGEARHSGRIVHEYLIEMEDQQTWDRQSVYESFAEDYPPVRENVNILHSLYADYCWDSTFGGDSWAKIVEAVELYETLTPSAFIDHCADLQHNGGIAFDKSVWFWDTTGYSGIMNFLNWKFKARSIVYELPSMYQEQVVRDMLSNKVIYLMNKLFAISGRSPTWDKNFRYVPNSKHWNLELKDMYSSNYNVFSGETYEYSCDYCGGHLSRYSEDNYYENGEVYCPKCWYYCEGCEERHAGHTEYEEENGYPCCEWYFDEYMMECEKCDYTFSKTDSGLCESCEEEHTCEECGDFEWDSVSITNLDTFSHDVYLSDCEELLCPDCIKKFLNAGWRMFYSNKGIVMSSNIDKVMEYPYEELLEIELCNEFTHFSLIPEHLKQGGF